MQLYKKKIIAQFGMTIIKHYYYHLSLLSSLKMNEKGRVVPAYTSVHSYDAFIGLSYSEWLYNRKWLLTYISIQT